METTREAKTQLYRASSDDVFSDECAPHFFVMRSSVRLYILFSRIFFGVRRLHVAAKTKESTTSFSRLLAHIRNKSHLEFFLVER